ncbi:MAG: lipoyl(octanoyl) transferase LipB [Bacillota bacterium]
MKTCLVLETGVTPYQQALEWQERLVAARRAGLTGDLLILLEHPPVFTFGRKGGRENLLVPEQELRLKGVETFSVNRGGDVTFHGPGQLVGYPVIDLKEHRTDIHWYIKMLEEVLIRVAGEYGLPAARYCGYTGVWVEGMKLASIGVAVRGWVTMHGFAINVANDLQYFKMINPCGLKNVAMASLSGLLGRKVSVSEVSEKVKSRFAEVFQFRIIPAEMDQLLKRFA